MLVHQIDRLLDKEAKKLTTLQFAMHLPASNLDYHYSSTDNQHQAFHSASVGKLLTSTLVFIAIEKGWLTLDTRVQTILKPGLLNHLFVVEGQDYQDEVCVRHLLAHTSGINDYYSSKTAKHSSFLKQIRENPDVFWTPEDLLDYTRYQQEAIARPGQKFFYSDTGFVLLGLMLEAIFEAPFHDILDTYIFKPCHMTETTLAFYGSTFEAGELAPLIINGHDIHLFRSLSCDFAGGGLSTTAGDLLLFLSALHQGRLINQESLRQMADFKHQYHRGLYYGLGMMQVRFGEFFFLLRGMPDLQGHWGMTGVHACYHPQTGACFVLNVGNDKDMARSFKLLIKLLRLLASEGQL